MIKKKQEQKADGSGWLGTYGDLVTLLMCFFVLLFAMSEIDVQKFRSLAASFKGEYVINTGTPGILDGGMTLDSSPMIGSVSPEMKEASASIEKQIEDQNLAEAVELCPVEDGLALRVLDTVLFETGSAEVKPEGQAIFTEISKILKELDNDIRIEGHTDNVPIQTDFFPSNWELSTGRACNVLRYMIESTGFPQDRLSAAGYGEIKPAQANTTVEGKSKNRRVDIVVLNKPSDK